MVYNKNIMYSNFFDVNPNLISVEGIDGCGKSTITNEFKKSLFFKNDEAEIIRFDTCPFNEFATKYIRHILSNESKVNIDVKNTSLLYAFISDFILHQNNIEKTIEEYKNKINNKTNSFIFTDRYFISTLVYQSTILSNKEDDKYYDILKMLQYANLKLPKYIIRCKCDPKKAIERINKRSETTNEKKEIFEKLDFLTKIDKKYEFTFEHLFQFYNPILHDRITRNRKIYILEIYTDEMELDDYRESLIPLTKKLILDSK